MAYRHFLFLGLLISSLFCGFINPFTTPQPLVSNVTLSVSACSVAIYTFQATSSGSFYFDLAFSPQSPGNNFSVSLAPYGPTPGDDTILNAFDTGCASYRCNAAGLAGCTLTVACGDQGNNWFVYVKSENNLAGNYSFSLFIRPQAPVQTLTVASNFSEDNYIQVFAGPINVTLATLSAFDQYTFTIPNNIPLGSSIEILLVPVQPLGFLGPAPGVLNSFLSYGTLAFPQQGAKCITYSNASFLRPCDVRQGGTWGLTVQRSVNYQNYTVGVFVLPGVVDTLQDGIQSKSTSLRNALAEAYFTYTLPDRFIADDNSTQAQLTFVVENIIGGTVKIEIFNSTTNQICTTLTCFSKEGCHVVIPYCQIQQGTYLVVVTALVVNDPDYQVQFTVLGRLFQVPTIKVDAGASFTGNLNLSEYAHYVISNPGGSNWLDLELYVDTDINDLPASMYIGFQPFPANDQMYFNDFHIPVEGILPIRGNRRNEFPSCRRDYNQSFWKRCSALRTNTNNGVLRLCTLQLDPCELQNFPNGIFLTVFNNNQSLSSATTTLTPQIQHTWTQNPMSYTVYTKVWNPHYWNNCNRQVCTNNIIQHGRVITDYVYTGLRKAYQVINEEHDISITISSTYPEIAGSTSDTTPEITYEIVYAQENQIGPWCNTCYRRQIGPTPLPVRGTVTIQVPKCIERGNGDSPQNFEIHLEYTYLVITALERSSPLNYTENRFVITAKNRPPRIVQILQPGTLSESGPEFSFGQVETWILAFDANALYSSILSIKFRAHPRANRLLTLSLRDPREYNPYCNVTNANDLSGPDFYCDRHFQVETFTCNPNDVNKGYCLLNFQICRLAIDPILQFGILNRVFHVDIGYTTGPLPPYGGTGDYNNYSTSVPVEQAYSLIFNLVDQSSTNLRFDTPFLFELPTQQYRHFDIYVPGDAVGAHYFIIEAYFDSSAIFNDRVNSNPPRNITMFINDPTNNVLAGDPFHSIGCLCHKNAFSSQISGTKKFTYVTPPCLVIEGQYRFSFYTDAWAIYENPPMINVRARLIPYIQPLAYETLTDFSLYPGQSIAWQIEIDPNMITSNTYVDKELRIKLSENNAHYGGVKPSFQVVNTPGNCTCGVAGAITYGCASQSDIFTSYECRLNLGFCQLNDGRSNNIFWYIIVDYASQTGTDVGQVLPMTLFVTKDNFWRSVGTMSSTSLCGYLDRTSSLISTYVESYQLQYWSVSFAGNGIFSAYVENITSGDVDIFFGNGFLPSPNPGCATAQARCVQGSLGCKLQTSCPVTFVGVRPISRIRNRPVAFRVSSCTLANAELVLSQGFPPSTTIQVPVNSVDVTDTALNLAGLTNANFPMLVIFATLPTGTPLGQFSITYTITSCGSCPASFSRSVNCTGLNCTLAVNVCELPLNYATQFSNIRISSFFATSQTYTLGASAVPIPAPTTINSNSIVSATASQNNWMAVSWTLGSEVFSPDAGIQTSFLSFTPTSGFGPVQQFVASATDCPVLFTGSQYAISSCCTQPGTYTFAFFQLGFSQVTYQFNAQLITQSRHQYYSWNSANTPATSSVTMPGFVNNTVYAETMTVIPATTIPRYSTLIVQPTTSDATVAVYINRDQQAGVPATHGGCFANEGGKVTLGPGPNFNATVPFFICETFPLTTSGGGLWVAFENTLLTQQTGSVTVSVAQPIAIALGGGAVNFNSGVVGVNQQFYFAPKENSWSQRLFRVNISFNSPGTAISNVYINYGSAAGPTGGCQGSIASNSAVTSPFSISFASCKPPALPLQYYYIGVVTATQTGSYSILAEEYTTLDGNTNYVSIGATPISSSSIGQYFFTATGVTNTSVAVVTINGFTGNQVFNISIFRDGNCLNLGDSFCSVQNDQSFKCSSFIPACELKEGFTYHVSVTPVGGVTYNINVQIINLPEQSLNYVFGGNTFPGVGSNATQLFEGTPLQSQDFAAYKFTLPSDVLLTGERYEIFLDSQICGQVDAWAVQNYRTGVCVLNSQKCQTPGCLLWRHDHCSVLLNGAQPPALDVHILIRAKGPIEFQKIQYRFQIKRTLKHQMFPFRFLEKHVISPYSAVEDYTPVCPAVATTALSTTCCSGLGGIPWIVPRTVYSMPVEGDQWLGYSNFHRLHLRLIDDRIFSARLRVYNGYPSFCDSLAIPAGQANTAPNNVLNPGLFATCVATNTARNCTVNIQVPNCGHIDAHQFFFTVDSNPGDPVFDGKGGRLPTDPATVWPVYSISHTAQPYDIIGVSFSTDPQYFRSTLALNEISYYKVFHQRPDAVNYHFVVEMVYVYGGTVTITNTWNECGTASCQDTDCRNYDDQRPCNEFLLDCSCKFELLRCVGGEITAHTPESFFQLKAIALTSTPTVEVQIKVTFVEELLFQPDTLCDLLGCADVRYYNTWSQKPSATQLYRYRIRGVQQHTQLSIHDGSVTVPGFPTSTHGAACRVYRACDAFGPEQPGGYKQCETYYRNYGDALPYATTNSFPSGGAGQCSRNLSNFENLGNFKLNLELTLVSPPITPLADGNLTDSTYFTTVGNCQVRNESYYYSFTPTKGTYMVVELWSIQNSSATPETLQMWITPNHIAWNRMNENPQFGCTTTTSLPNNVKYCRYILGCSYTPGTTYYIQVVDTFSLLTATTQREYFHHKIRATTMDPIRVPLTHGSGVNFTLPYDNRQIVTVVITGADGLQTNEEQDVQVFVKGNANTFHTWLTRSLFGGDLNQGNVATTPGGTCTLATAPNTKAAILSVPMCWNTNQGDTFFASIIRTEGTVPNANCNDAQISVLSRFTQIVNPVNGTFPGGTVNALTITRGQQDFGQIGALYKYDLPALGQGDIVYARVSGYASANANLGLKMFKGNHINQSLTTYGISCQLGCPVATTQLPNTNVIWGDLCWHCGTGVHGPTFVQVLDLAQDGNVNALAFNLQVQVTSWTSLTDQWLTTTFPFEEASLAFFSMAHTRDEGTRVDIEVLSGNPIEVNVYASSCDLRASGARYSQYFCFRGVRCEIPINRHFNFGSHYRTTLTDSPYLGPNEDLRIVVRGFDTQYRMRQIRNQATCTSLTTTNAPFCSTSSEAFNAYSYWGEDESNSFIAKDRNALEFYQNLTQAFTCSVTDICDCPPQTQACRDAIQAYACESIFNPCDGVGLEQGPTYRTCRNVEFYCGRSWLCAGIPRLTCNHTFYTNGISPVTQSNIPINELDDPFNTGNGRLAGGYIALIVLLSLLALIVLVILGYILYQRSSSLSSVVFDDSGNLGEYEAM